MANMPWHTHQAHEPVRLSGCSLVTLATSLLLIFVVRFSQTKFHFFCTSNIYNMAQICIQPHLLAVELHGLVYKHVRFHGLGLETAGILCRHFLKEGGGVRRMKGNLVCMQKFVTMVVGLRSCLRLFSGLFASQLVLNPLKHDYQTTTSPLLQY